MSGSGRSVAGIRVGVHGRKNQRMRKSPPVFAILSQSPSWLCLKFSVHSLSGCRSPQRRQRLLSRIKLYCSYPLYCDSQRMTAHCGRGAGVGRGLGVGRPLGPGRYWIVSTGGLALSRVSNRLAVVVVDSSPNTSQPKLLAGLSSHDCTSATIWAELHMYCPTPPTD